MGIVNSILSVIWLVLICVNYHKINKRQKAIAELTLSLHKECIALDNLINAAKKVSDTQDNFNWTAITILTRRIHDLEESNAR